MGFLFVLYKVVMFLTQRLKKIWFFLRCFSNSTRIIYWWTRRRLVSVPMKMSLGSQKFLVLIFSSDSPNRSDKSPTEHWESGRRTEKQVPGSLYYITLWPLLSVSWGSSGPRNYSQSGKPTLKKSAFPLFFFRGSIFL